VKQLFALFLIGIINSFVFAQQMRIGVYRDYSIKRIALAYNSGSYAIYADTTTFGSLLPNEFIDVSVENNLLRLKLGVVDKGLYHKIVLHQNNIGSSITLDPKGVSGAKPRKYEEDIELFAADKAITVVNLVDIDNYLAGVVESEGGGGQDIEYYKVQALMSRTYALKYVNKHNKEGFSLCDRVHCQAYHNMLRFTPTIREAVKETTGSVMLDTKNQLIDAYFHANCGGQTSEPDYIWNNSVPYLTTFQDTFCIYTRQAKWGKKIDKKEWEDYLTSQFNYPITDSVWYEKLYQFDQEERKAFLVSPALGIPLRDIRTKFNLRSTFFSIRLENEEVIISGKGYGHGVGLCQEGAMKMARLGYDFRQIARFYFPGAHIIDLSEEEFFKQLARTGPFILK
jgi:stage II sporulation protein D